MYFFFDDLLGKAGYVFGTTALFICLSVCKQHYSISYEWIAVKLYDEVQSSTRKNWLDFSGNPEILRWVNEQKTQNSRGIPRSRCR